MKRANFPYIVETLGLVGFGIGGLFFVIYGIAGGGLIYGAVGLGCLAWAKTCELSLRLRDHIEGFENDG